MNTSHTFLLGGQQYSWDMPPDSSPNLSVVSTCASCFIGGRKYKWDHSKPPDLVIKYCIPTHQHLRESKDCMYAIHQVVPAHQLGGKNYRWDFHLAPSPLMPVYLVGGKSYKWDFYLAPSWLLLTDDADCPFSSSCSSPAPAAAAVHPHFNKPVLSLVFSSGSLYCWYLVTCALNPLLLDLICKCMQLYPCK